MDPSRSLNGNNAIVLKGGAQPDWYCKTSLPLSVEIPMGFACDKLHGDTLPYERGYTVMTVRIPHGVTGHIIPWNYPMQIAGRSVRESSVLHQGSAEQVFQRRHRRVGVGVQHSGHADRLGRPHVVLDVVDENALGRGEPQLLRLLRLRARYRCRAQDSASSSVHSAIRYSPTSAGCTPAAWNRWYASSSGLDGRAPSPPA